MHVDNVMSERMLKPDKLKSDGTLAGTPFPPALLTEEEIRAILDERKSVEEEPQLISLGEFKIYHYCACVKCTNSGNGITATGTTATEGRTIAADWDVIPPGTEVVIGDIHYIVEDRGGGIRGNRLDIFVECHHRAWELGTYSAEIFILK
jgi:3D (Asp-Asp-Asp) domain-containing protein